MVRKLFFMLSVAFMLSGCTGPTLTLDKQFAPLERVVEAPGNVIPTHTITTIDETSYVTSLKQFLLDYPQGSAGYTAVLLHERTHVIRENAFPGGPAAWIAKYLIDRDFRWQEEKAGWKVEILYNIQHGQYANPAEIAATLNQNYRFGGRMVSYDEAIKWVQGVINGTE